MNLLVLIMLGKNMHNLCLVNLEHNLKLHLNNNKNNRKRKGFLIFFQGSFQLLEVFELKDYTCMEAQAQGNLFSLTYSIII